MRVCFHETKVRSNVRPGITGLAQINGRTCIEMERKFEYDVWYVDNWSLWLDLKILLRTVVYVALRRGIGGNGAPTEPVWTGNPSLRALASLPVRLG